MSLYIFSVSFILGKKEAMLPSNYQCQHLDQLDFLLFKVYVIQNKFHQILIFHHVTSYFTLIKIHKKKIFLVDLNINHAHVFRNTSSLI